MGERLLCKQGVVGSIPTVSKPLERIMGCGRVVEREGILLLLALRRLRETGPHWLRVETWGCWVVSRVLSQLKMVRCVGGLRGLLMYVCVCFRAVAWSWHGFACWFCVRVAGVMSERRAFGGCLGAKRR